MYNFRFLTDETINERLADTLDVSLLTDAKYQALLANLNATRDALDALKLSCRVWHLIDAHSDAIHSCNAAYATAAYRLGFKDGVNCLSCVSSDDCLNAAEKILDALENGSVPIAWHNLNRPALQRTIAQVLEKLSKF